MFSILAPGTLPLPEKTGLNLTAGFSLSYILSLIQAFLLPETWAGIQWELG